MALNSYSSTLQEAWDTYSATARAAWSRWPPKTSPCGKQWPFDPEYEATIRKAKAARVDKLEAYHIYTLWVKSVEQWP